MNELKHLKTILTHKKWVLIFASKCGITWQGIIHDLSKFSPTEFRESVKYYTGTKSPIDVCKEQNGYSKAWLHHKGQNKHHYEYWQDNFDKGTTHLKMPEKYVKEMICDFLAAGKAYQSDKFTFALEYVWWLNKIKNPIAMHADTKHVVNQALHNLNAAFGERSLATFSTKDWKLFSAIIDAAIALKYE